MDRRSFLLLAPSMSAILGAQQTDSDNGNYPNAFIDFLDNSLAADRMPSGLQKDVFSSVRVPVKKDGGQSLSSGIEWKEIQGAEISYANYGLTEIQRVSAIHTAPGKVFSTIYSDGTLKQHSREDSWVQYDQKSMVVRLERQDLITGEPPNVLELFDIGVDGSIDYAVRRYKLEDDLVHSYVNAKVTTPSAIDHQTFYRTLRTLTEK